MVMRAAARIQLAARDSRNFPNQMRNFRHLFRSLGSTKNKTVA